MTTAPAWPSTESVVDSLLVAPQLRDVCLRIPLRTAPDDDELARINRDNPGWKVELGSDCELEVRMIAGGDSSDIAAELVVEIGLWRRSGGGGRIRESDGTYHVYHPTIGRRTRAPDVSWVSPVLLEATPRANRPRTGFWSLCPTFVIEVRSPSDSLPDQQQRMQEWLLFGAELGWLVDPFEQTVWIYRPDQEAESIERPAVLSGETVLVGLTVEMNEIWSLIDEGNDESKS